MPLIESAVGGGVDTQQSKGYNDHSLTLAAVAMTEVPRKGWPVLSPAKYMAERSQWKLSNLALQKLCYIAHMVCLGRHEKPLVAGHFEAWAWGPVHPELYHKVSRHGRDPVAKETFGNVQSPDETEERQYLDLAVDKLGHDLPRLLAITHWEHGAWAKLYNPKERGTVIPNPVIMQEYRDRVCCNEQQ